MNKAELLAVVKERNPKITKKDAGIVLDAVLDAIADTLASGETITLVGFGRFEVRDRQAREGRQPRTGEKIVIPAARVAAFSAGKVLKEKVAG
jgi:DNA-binding protein HU-beta